MSDKNTIPQEIKDKINELDRLNRKAGSLLNDIIEFTVPYGGHEDIFYDEGYCTPCYGDEITYLVERCLSGEFDD